MATHYIMAMIIDQRTSKAPMVQEVLTKHGCHIKMRLGLHETDQFCSEEGLVLLKLGGSEVEIKDLEEKLNALEGVTAQTMSISSKKQE